jgi:mRNA interferase RelE/StbE
VSYRVTLTVAAVKERGRLDSAVRGRVDEMLKGLRDEPRPAGVKKLAGSKLDWRVRIGDYRILYEIDDTEQLVTVWRIAHRREVYR